MKTTISKENAIDILEQVIVSRSFKEKMDKASINLDNYWENINAFTRGLFNIEEEDEIDDMVHEIFSMTVLHPYGSAKKKAETLYFIFSQIALSQAAK
ncbi:hypothetical protein [Maribacter sp. 2307UL18-2]|uniref:hypothetical protein n=1 Tax=Maribacter sp. 2307UL18-2 TaxID=3386274 RepID=UPI0039BC30D9